MYVQRVDNFEHWREIARQHLQREVPPQEIIFRSTPGENLLFAAPESSGEDRAAGLRTAEQSSSATQEPGTGGPARRRKTAPRVSARFVQLARKVACHTRPDRWNLMYRLLWRLTHEEPRLLEDATDEDVACFQSLAHAVDREIHHMQAFVRFQRVVQDQQEWFFAWFEPAHPVLRLTADFFAARFKGMNWCILTPFESVYWDQQELRWGAGVPRKDLGSDDGDLEELWRTYYSVVFNPARVTAKQKIPKRYWQTMPETTTIPELIAHSSARAQNFIESAPLPNSFVPATDRLDVLARAAVDCRACDLCQRATQTVFGAGPADASMVLVGEQPGDEEDLAGHPFVGPAGKVLDQALEAAGISRRTVYLTNVVKHFHWEPRGKRRLHKKPGSRHIVACSPWLEAEMAIVKPEVLVCLGATAIQAVFGHKQSAAIVRGTFSSTRWSQKTLATWHPAAILRAPATLREPRFLELVEHLTRAHQQGAQKTKAALQ